MQLQPLPPDISWPWHLPGQLPTSPSLLPVGKFGITLQNRPTAWFKHCWVSLPPPPSKIASTISGGCFQTVEQVQLCLNFTLCSPYNSSLQHGGLGIPLFRVSRFPFSLMVQVASTGQRTPSVFQTGHNTFPQSIEKFPEDLLEFKPSS